MGPVRLLDVGQASVAGGSRRAANRYGEETINRKLSDLDWVSRAAIAHEAVVESFIDHRAVVPMKLFTIFNSDDRALEQVRGDRRRVGAIVKRVANQIEWGVRVTPPSSSCETGRLGRQALHPGTRRARARPISLKKRPSVMRPPSSPSVHGKP